MAASPTGTGHWYAGRVTGHERDYTAATDRHTGVIVSLAVFECRRYRTLAGAGHTFAASGWCVYGCGCRDDGAVMNPRTGEWIRRPAAMATPAGLDDLADTPKELRAADIRGP